MNPERLRIQIAKLLDEYAGKAVIRIGLVLRIFRKGKEPEEIKKILFIKFWGIGSIILAEPALRCLRERYPGVEIHFLTLKQNRELFSMIPLISKLHWLEIKQLPLIPLKSILLIRKLRNERYDLIFDGEFFVHYSAIIGRIARPAQLIGFGRPKGMKAHLLDVRVPFLENIHTTQQYMNLVQENWILRKERTGDKPCLELADYTRPDFVFGDSRYIVLNINASPLATERRWPRERFLFLAESLLREFSLDLILIGSKSEREYVEPLEKVLANPTRVHNLAGKLRLPDVAYLLKNAVVLISNDSGPVHLASALDTPVVAFYGPETPKRYGPLSSKRLVFYQGLWCSPCMSVENAKTVNCINNLACMKGIETDAVIRRVCGFLEKLFEIEKERSGQLVNGIKYDIGLDHVMSGRVRGAQ